MAKGEHPGCKSAEESEPKFSYFSSESGRDPWLPWLPWLIVSPHPVFHWICFVQAKGAHDMLRALPSQVGVVC